MNEGDLASGFFCVFKEEMVDGVLTKMADPAATRSLARASLLLWRSSTFVIPIFIGGLVAAFYRCSPKNEVHTGDMPNRQTFYSLQKETYVERYEEVESLVETSRLSRKAVLEKLKPKKRRKKKATTKKTKEAPTTLAKQDYDEIELDDLEDDE